MAMRIYFKSIPTSKRIFSENFCEFQYFNGFSIFQKQKSINSMHEQIKKNEKEAHILEISSKSNNDIGVALSAFNLKLTDENTKKELPVENIFQSSKVFEDGGPYRELLYLSPKEAKKDIRLKKSGKLIKFNYNNTDWLLEPKSMFYDWIYISALNNNSIFSNKIINYNVFTDIEFNHKNSYNCQARAAAIFVSLKLNDLLNELLKDRSKFIEYYIKMTTFNKQISFLD